MRSFDDFPSTTIAPSLPTPYSLMNPEPKFNIDMDDAVDAIYELWLVARSSRCGSSKFTGSSCLLSHPRNSPIAVWRKSSLYYDCYHYEDEMFTPVLAPSLPSS